MTNATITLTELAEKGADIDVLRQMVHMAQRLMEIDVEGRCGAGYDEKSAARLNSRNGYRDRTWDTRAGTVELKIPKLRQGSYFPEFRAHLGAAGVRGDALALQQHLQRGGGDAQLHGGPHMRVGHRVVVVPVPSPSASTGAAGCTSRPSSAGAAWPAPVRCCAGPCHPSAPGWRRCSLAV